MDTEEALIDTLSVEIQRKKIQINNHNINYIIAGDGPPLLLLHGANFGWGIWHTNVEALSKHFSVYALDLPGAGRSSTVDYRNLDLEEDLFDVVDLFIQKLGLNNINIVGCSIGGWLAMRFAITNSEKIDKLVVENSVGFADYFSFSEKIMSIYPLAQFVSNTILKPIRSNKRIELFLRGIFHDKKLHIQDEFLEYFYETMARSHNLRFLSRLSQLHKEFPLGENLKKIVNETLIIWGAKDKIVPLEKNQDSFSLIPNSTVRIMEDASHIPSFEDPEQFNKMILNFLV